MRKILHLHALFLQVSWTRQPVSQLTNNTKTLTYTFSSVIVRKSDLQCSSEISEPKCASNTRTIRVYVYTHTSIDIRAYAYTSIPIRIRVCVISMYELAYCFFLLWKSHCWFEWALQLQWKRCSSSAECPSIVLCFIRMCLFTAVERCFKCIV